MKLGRTRRGVSAIWVLVVLAVISTISVAAVGRFVAARRQVDAHRTRVQADYLALAGYEMAADKLLTDPKYAGETLAPITGGEVKIAVQKDPGESAIYRIESEARFSGNGRITVVRTVKRAIKRVAGLNGVRLETVSAG